MRNLFHILLAVSACTQKRKKAWNICGTLKPLCHHITGGKGIQRIRREIITKIKSTGDMVNANKVADMIHMVGKSFGTRCSAIDELRPRIHPDHTTAHCKCFDLIVLQISCMSTKGVCIGV